MKFIPVDWEVESWKDASKLIFKKKVSHVYVQAPEKFQDLINHFIKGLSPWDRFLSEIASRTGVPNPETDPRTGWVHAVRMSRDTAARVLAVEPDIDQVLEKVESKLTIKDKQTVLHEARLWYLSREGFLRRLINFFDFPVQFLPPNFRMGWARFWLKIYGALVNIIPGDQQDFVAAVSIGDSLLSRRMAEALDQHEDGPVFLDKWYAEPTRKAFLELAD